MVARMTSGSFIPVPPPAPQPPRAHRLPSHLRLAAAKRLVPATGVTAEAAGRRLLDQAPSLGIDFDLAWATLGPMSSPLPVRQLCLAVVGAGRTAMLFTSRPASTQHCGSGKEQRAELAAAAALCFAELPGMRPGRVAIAQALLESSERLARDALTDAGMRFVGDLAYLRRPFSPLPRPGVQIGHGRAAGWPEGVEVRPLGSLDDPAEAARLVAALDASYTDTLDCPALCGVRRTEDVLDSHKAAGRFDRARWLLVLNRGEPAGCCLLSFNPDLRSLELVYLGLGPSLRGRGIATPLLELGIARCASCNASEVACAVDQRNTPALSLYRRLGFARFDERTALVRALS